MKKLLCMTILVSAIALAGNVYAETADADQPGSKAEISVTDQGNTSQELESGEIGKPEGYSEPGEALPADESGKAQMSPEDANPSESAGDDSASE